MDVDQTRAVSGFSSGKDGKGKWNGKGKSKDAKGKGKGKKGDKSKDQKPISKPEQFQGYCGYCDKWDTSVQAARNALPMPSRKVVRHQPLLTMETSQP